MATRYEVRMNADGDEWRVMVLNDNFHARTVLTTTVKEEAYVFAAAFDMKAALESMVHTHKPCGSRIGSPGSVARMEQEEQEAAIDAALAALNRCDTRPMIAK